MRHIARTITLAAISAAAIAVPAAAASNHHGRSDHRRGHAGAVFVQTDATSGNAILSYRRSADGALTFVGRVATGGNGGTAGGATADPLASQGSLVSAADGSALLAVNAGSNSVSVFGVHGADLTLRQTIASGGLFPDSIAVHGDLVYVLNAGGDGSVSGFRLDDGRLRPITAGTRTLGLGNTVVPNFLTSPGQVAFTPDGRQLVVTTKLSTNSIDVFGVGRHGRLSATATATPSATPVPFALAFGPNGELVVAEAGAGTVSTYALGRDGSAHVIGSQADTQAAVCWIVQAHGYFYVSNAGSANVSAYRLSSSGAPQLIGIAGATDPGTTDSVAADHGRFIYVESGGSGTVDGFSVTADGTLTKVVSLTGLPTGIEGIAAIG